MQRSQSEDSETTCAPKSIARGDRLRPSRFSRLYWHLRCLRSEMEKVIDQYVANSSADCLVDYGCGNMPYRPLFTRHVGKYLGSDLAGNEQAGVKIEPSGRLPLADESADIVLSSQVLEHVADPLLYLAESKRVLREDGLLVLSTHGVWRYHPDPVDY